MSDEQISRLFAGDVVITKSWRHVSISASTDAKAMEIFDCLTEINRQASSLLPCPFCGGKGRLLDDGWVECDQCVAFGPSAPKDYPGDSRQWVIDAWNRRHAT